jgi:hypothetical protein
MITKVNVETEVIKENKIPPHINLQCNNDLYGNIIFIT